MLGEDVAVADVQCEIVKSILGHLGVRAAHGSADNQDHKADRGRKNLLPLVEAHNVLTYTKHGSVMRLHGLIVNSARGRSGVPAPSHVESQEHSTALVTG